MKGRILIVDGTATNRIIYKVKLGDAFFETLLADDGEACLRMARAERPDLILLDLALDAPSATDVLATLRADPVTRAISVIALSSSRDSDLRMAALRAGADDVMSKPVNDAVLLARIRNLLRSREAAGVVASAWGAQAPSMMGLAEGARPFEPPGSIGLVAMRPEGAVQWKRILQSQMRDQLVVMPRDRLLALPATLGDGAPDVYVIDSDLDQPNAGLRILSELRSHTGARHSAYCIVIPDGEDQTAAMAFDLGADDVVPRSMVTAELGQRLRTLLRRKRDADRMRATVEDGLRMAMIDPLTGTYNRRYALPRLAGIAAQATAEGTDFAVMVVDLDRFKQVNDRHGHAAGDCVLVEVARRLSENLRMTDLLARIGGEEFLVALPQTSLPEARRIAERLREVVGERPVTLPSGEGLRVTVSIGVSVCAPGQTPPEDVSEMVDLADRALMSSKTAGRNVVTIGRSAA